MSPRSSPAVDQQSSFEVVLPTGDGTRNPQDLILRMQDFCGFLARLDHVPAEAPQCPMADGKWSVQEVIAHIMVCDEVCFQDAAIPIENGRRPPALVAVAWPRRWAEHVGAAMRLPRPPQQ
jgi:hypothetical protein